MSNYNISIPAKVVEIFPTWEGTPPFKGFNIDNMRLLLSIISTHQREDDEGVIYSQLKMEYLRNLVWNADKYINLFREAGIINRFGGYVPGNHTWKYCFTEAYQSPYVQSKLENQKLLRKMSQVYAKKGREETRLYPMQKQQLGTMTINYDKAVELLKETFSGDIDKYNYAIGQATRINNKEFYFVRDDSGYRVHTPLTNLKKILRSQIQIKGKYLSGLDIGNSQIYFAIKFLLDPDSVIPFFPGKYPLMMLKSLRLSEQQDVSTFVYLASKAKFYKYMEGLFEKEGLFFGGDLKKKIFTILFEKNHLTSKAKKIFQKHFPNVDKAFSVLRMIDYTDFVNCLARMESHAINELIIERLNNEYPDMVAQQIYDNLVTSIATDDVETAYRVMTEELTSFIGYPPTLKVENFFSNINTT